MINQKDNSKCPQCDGTLINVPRPDGTESNKYLPCPFCVSLESHLATIEPEVNPTPIEKVWNWEQFFTLVRNSEIALQAESTDDAIQERIKALRELDRVTDLLRQSIKIRIMADGDVLESHGKKVRASKKTKDMSYTPNEVAGLPKVSERKTKLEKVRDGLADLGIDFDDMMLELKAKKTI